MKQHSPLIGHERVWSVILRLWERGKLPAALLLTGPPGIGKRTFTRALAARLFSAANPETHPDALRIDPATDLSGREAVSHLLQRVHQHPVLAPVRVIFLDRIDEFSPPAAALLLKAIEDSPAFAKFLLTALTAARVAPTIQSRTLVRELHPVSSAVLAAALVERGVAQFPASEIAELAGGRPGLALRLAVDTEVLERYRRWAKVLQSSSFRERSAAAAAIAGEGRGEEFLSFLQSQLRSGGSKHWTPSTAALRRARESVAMLRQSVPANLVIEYALMSLSL